MEYIVMKSIDLRQLPGSIDGVSFTLPVALRPKNIYPDEARACAAAQERAEADPGTLYMVLKPIIAYEAKKPEKVDVVVKEYTAAGELVPMKV